MDKQAFQKLAKIHSQKPVIMGYENGKRFYEFEGYKFASVTTALSATKPQKDIDALNKIKATSKAAKGPWKTFPEEMMRKTVVKRASKYWPVCEDLNKAVEVLNDSEGLGDAYQPTLKEVGESNMFIDDTHIDEIEALILTSGADRVPFLSWLGVDETQDITVEMYPKAVAALNQKAKA